MAKKGNVIKGGRDRSKKTTLEVRQAAYKPDPRYQGAMKMPGSNNSHKCWPH